MLKNLYYDLGVISNNIYENYNLGTDFYLRKEICKQVILQKIIYFKNMYMEMIGERSQNMIYKRF